jgi:SAM-dependent methyltransferase
VKFVSPEKNVVKPLSVSGIRCPACANSTTTDLGVISYKAPENGWPATREIYECNRCGLLYLNHEISRDALIDSYEELPSDAWEDIAQRRDFELARREISRRHSRGRVLDVGCFRGDFLRSLPAQFERFGIEPSRAAREEAARRNVRLLGQSVEGSELEERFDAIVLMDVIEHVDAPAEVISKIAEWLAPGGHLIISTGNTGALPWRMMRLNYWYYIPQHIRFFNRRWFQWMADRLGLRLIAAHTFSHSRSAYGRRFVPERWYDFLRCTAFWATRRFHLPWPRMEAPGTPTWPDHLLVVLEAPK